jgi:ABC-type transporter Mla subunit MlaD
MTSAVEIARQEWEEANRRLEASADDRRRYRRLLEQVDALTDELRRRVGQTFTLAQLADEYGRADEWAREVLLDEEPPAGAVATVALAQAAAFHLYARGAVDYSP